MAMAFESSASHMHLNQVTIGTHKRCHSIYVCIDNSDVLSVYMYIYQIKLCGEGS